MIGKSQGLIDDDTKDLDMVRQGNVGVCDINAVDRGKTAELLVCRLPNKMASFLSGLEIFI